MPSGKADPAGALRIELPVGEPAIEQVRLAVLAYLEPFGPGDRVTNRVEVILEELVSNVVRHSAGATQVTVEAAMAGDSLELTIVDDGPAFDPTAAADPAGFTSLEAATPGGLGIAMVRRMSTLFAYSRADGRNRVTVCLAAR